MVSPAALFGHRRKQADATPAQGWAPARCKSRTNHYFRGQISVCGLFNTGPSCPPVVRSAGPNDCKHCRRLAEKEGLT